MRIALALFGATFLSASASASARAQAVPAFRDYPVPMAVSANRHALVLTPSDALYRTRLRAAASQPANFAGHYVLTTWGCGSSCVTGAAVDLFTGRVIWLPANVLNIPGSEASDSAPAEALSARLDSTLLVLSGERGEGRGDAGAHYYKLAGGSFVHLLDIPFPTSPASSGMAAVPPSLARDANGMALNSIPNTAPFVPASMRVRKILPACHDLMNEIDNFAAGHCFGVIMTIAELNIDNKF